MNPSTSEIKSIHEVRQALRFAWLTPFYDLIIYLFMRDRVFKNALVDQADLQPHERILDFGCGTGTLTCLIQERAPAAQVIGLDVDPRILALARDRAARHRLTIDWKKGTLAEHQTSLAPLDHVFTSMVLHHLTDAEKSQTLALMFHLLRPGGIIHIADFGPPRGIFPAIGFFLVRMLDGFDRTRSNAKGKLPTLLNAAGFHDVRSTGSFSSVCGTMTLLQGTVP